MGRKQLAIYCKIKVKKQLTNIEPWQNELAGAFKTLSELAAYLDIKITPELQKVADRFPVFVPKYYADLINKDNITEDPIFKQCFPDIREINCSNDLNFDGLGENNCSPQKRIIHKYKIELFY